MLGAASDSSRAAREPEAAELGLPGIRHGCALSVRQAGDDAARLEGREAQDVKAGFVADRYLTLPKGKADKLALTLESKEPLIAPVQNGQPVGVVKVALEGQPVAEFPMIALEEVPLANLFGRAVDTVKLWFTAAEKPCPTHRKWFT